MATLGFVFCLVTALIAVTTALPWKLPGAVEPDSQDPVYLYESMLMSVAEYNAAKNAAALGLRSDRRNHVCYEDLGCFYKNGTYGNFWKLPSTPEYVGTKFLLYTSPSQVDYELLDYKKLEGSSFRADWPTTFIIPGFGNSPQDSWVPAFKDAVFHSVPQGNYILVDWTAGSKPPDYWAASANIQLVGAQVARLIATLNDHLGTKSESFHVVGYSLGAHAAGFVGHRLVQWGYRRVGKITALDPAGPMFDNGHNDAIVSTEDADFVAAIHSNGASLQEGGFGLYKQVGHIDFYPNGGRYQPGCPHAIWGALGDVLTFNFGNLPDSVKCNHDRALLLVIEALDPTCIHHSYACDSFESFQDGLCDSTPDGNMVVFGNHVASAQPHFLLTKEATGYCAQALKVTLTLASNSPKAHGDIFVVFVGDDGREETVEQLSKDEDLIPGGLVVQVLPSRFQTNSIQSVKIKYVPTCFSWLPTCKSIEMESLQVESLAYPTEKRCGGKTTLVKAQNVLTQLSPCDSR